MQAKDLMSKKPRAVRNTERLDAAARVMWENDCGFCPVVDAEGVVVGVLTDRDLCMAVYTQGRPLAELPAVAAMARHVRACRAEDPLAAVLQAMEQVQVHRLPVVDARGHLVGVIGTNDLLRAAVARPLAVDPGAVLRVMAAIGAPRRGEAMAAAPAVAAPAPAEAAAAATATAVPAAVPGDGAALAAPKAVAGTPSTPGAAGTTSKMSAPRPASTPSAPKRAAKPAAKPKPRAKGRG